VNAGTPGLAAYVATVSRVRFHELTTLDCGDLHIAGYAPHPACHRLGYDHHCVRSVD
jgi:hypothetical protein